MPFILLRKSLGETPPLSASSINTRHSFIGLRKCPAPPPPFCSRLSLELEGTFINLCPRTPWGDPLPPLLPPELLSLNKKSLTRLRGSYGRRCSNAPSPRRSDTCWSWCFAQATKRTARWQAWPKARWPESRWKTRQPLVLEGKLPLTPGPRRRARWRSHRGVM